VRGPAVERASAVPKCGRVKPGGGPTTQDLLPTPARDPGARRSLAPGLCAQTVLPAWRPVVCPSEAFRGVLGVYLGDERVLTAVGAPPRQWWLEPERSGAGAG
jgi:hypothetical protein